MIKEVENRKAEGVMVRGRGESNATAEFKLRDNWG